MKFNLEKIRISGLDKLAEPHNEIFKYNMRVRKPMTYGTVGTVGTIKIQTPESEKIETPTQGWDSHNHKRLRKQL
ncbi:hypothetical protein [Nitrosopumilus ureiphilus]|uniref:Uncharacterized protein n=1 Tax=Nitrosopumilus ureiphilus TaxID=1470067 RepID=A0A7D5RGV7_9ARCH|nr:hypothetical protein [Nitrosopumilus ureiphilus]QLH07265.1 hypothetical protein C5F50_09375 [Nitrosopumilus ureiphilus]